MSRVAFVSPCGYGNLGDAAIVDSLIAGIRRRLPGVEIVGFTLNPSDTAARHGVEALPCGGFSLPHYPIRKAPIAEPGAGEPAREARPSTMRRMIAALRGQAGAALPGARRGKRVAAMAFAEVRHRRMVAARLHGFDHVVVSGGGQLDDFWGGALGHPYTLYRFSQAARHAGARFDVLSVGTGNLATRLSRTFVGRALGAATYRSFRDARSRELAAAAGATAADPIVPDLAYGLPMPAVAPRGARPMIGIAPMCYADPRVWPKPDAARYANHVATMAGVAVHMVRAGRDVILFGTDRPDREPVAECHARVMAALDAPGRERVRLVMPERTGALLELIGSCDLVVAARFHGVLLSHVAGRPVLAVSHERKVATLMNELGHDAYCAPIDELDPAAASARIDELLRDHDAVSARIRDVAASYRRRVDEQFDQVFGA